MRFIPTRIHAVLDYLGGALLIALPFLLNFESHVATWLMVILGAGALLYSLFTDFELALVRKMSMAAHLMLDGIAGLVLLIAPWVIPMGNTPWWPFVLMGLVELGAALFTHSIPDDKRGHGHARGEPAYS